MPQDPTSSRRSAKQSSEEQLPSQMQEARTTSWFSTSPNKHLLHFLQEPMQFNFNDGSSFVPLAGEGAVSRNMAGRRFKEAKGIRKWHCEIHSTTMKGDGEVPFMLLCELHC